MTRRSLGPALCAAAAAWGVATVAEGAQAADEHALGAARAAVVMDTAVAAQPAGAPWPAGAVGEGASAAATRSSAKRTSGCRKTKRRRTARKGRASAAGGVPGPAAQGPTAVAGSATAEGKRAAAKRRRAAAKLRRTAAKRKRACRRRRAAAKRPQARVPVPPSSAPTPVAPSPTQPGTPVATVPLGRYVSVQAREFFFTLSRPLVATGEVTIELRNAGEDPHNLVVSPYGTHDSLLTFPDHDPADVSDARLTLQAGRYYLWCSLEGHEAAGMSATLRVE